MRGLIAQGRMAGALAWNTFLEAVRDRILYLLLFFGLFVFGASRLLAPLALGEGRRITLDVGFAALSAFGCLTAVFVGHQLIFREVERKTLYFLLARPLGRGAFVWGKYFGLLLTLAASVLFMGVLLLVVLLASHYAVGGAYAGAVCLVLLEMSILAAIAVALASVTSPVLAGVLTVAVWLIGHGSSDLQALAHSAASPGLHALVRAFSWVVPRLDLYGDILPLVHGRPYPPDQIVCACLYAACYATAALIGAALVLSRRELAL